jgi:ATP-binding cassette subfamily C protein CydD
MPLSIQRQVECMNINKRLLQYVKTMRVYVVLVGFLSLLTALSIVLQNGLIASIINGAFLAHQPLTQLLGALFILLAVLVLRAAIIWGNEVATNVVSGRVKSELRQRLFTRIFRLGPLYTRRENSAEISNTATDGVEALDAYFTRFFPQVCATAVIPTIILLVVFRFDFLSGIVLLVTWPILPFFMILIGKQANAMTARRWSLLNQLSAHFLDVLQGLTTLKLFGRSRVQEETIRHISERYGDTTMKVLRVAFLSSLVMEMGATISNAIIAVEIGLRLLYGDIPFQPAFFILLLTPEFYLPLRSLGSQFHASIESAAGAERIFDILETPLSGDEEKRNELPTKVETLTLQDVHYTYPTEDERKQEVLAGVSFQLSVGQKVALVGPSGAGKTTIAHLLLRFMEPSQGTIALNGRPISDLSPQDWRRLVAWQPQNPYVFNTSIAENIRLGNAQATMEQVIEAARNADLHEFIIGLPDGYDTVIGERGARLSGGQVQRLSLARVFLKNAPILILDEATSTLDAESEATVLQMIDRVLPGRIVLIIAHRMHTISSADRIIVLQDGSIEDQGKHKDLLERSPLYQDLVHAYEGEGASI